MKVNFNLGGGGIQQQRSKFNVYWFTQILPSPPTIMHTFSQMANCSNFSIILFSFSRPVCSFPGLHRPLRKPGPEHGPFGQRRSGRDPRPAAVFYEESGGRAPPSSARHLRLTLHVHYYNSYSRPQHSRLKIRALSRAALQSAIFKSEEDLCLCLCVYVRVAWFRVRIISTVTYQKKIHSIESVHGGHSSKSG